MDYNSLAFLEAEAERRRREKLAREMSHLTSYGQSQPAGIAFDGGMEKLARGVYRGPGEVAGLFDIAADYSPLGAAVDLFYPTDTTLKSTVDELMNLAAVEDAYNVLGGARGFPIENTLQGDVIDFTSPMISDPLAVGGAGMQGARMAGRGTRELLNELASTAAMEGPVGLRRQLGMIAGPGAEGADLAALDLAKKMKKQGSSADEIFERTGWWLDHPDGVPRFETDDSATRLLPIDPEKAQWLERKPSTSGNEEPLGPIRGVVDAPGAYSVYPDLADIRARGIAERGGGSYDPGDPFPELIELGVEQAEGGGGYKYPADAKETALHELQHAIQEREGMAKGGSPLGAPLESSGSEMGDWFMGYDWYNRLAGEVEARTVGRRADMTAAERAAKPFWKTPTANQLTPEDAAARLNRGEPVWAASEYNNFQVLGDLFDDYADDPEVFKRVIEGLNMKPENLPGLPMYDAPTSIDNAFDFGGYAGPDIPYDQQIVKMNSKGPAQAIGTAKGSQLGKTGAKRDTSPIITPEQLGDVKRGKRISTGSMTPTQAEKTGFHSRDDLGIGLDEMRENPKAFKINMDLIRGYPTVPTRKRNPSAVADEAQELFAANLDYLLDLAPNDFAPRSGNWYKGANALANDITNAYDIPIEASAAVLARLSPGMDWLQNVEQADRLVSVWRHNQDTVLTPAAFARAQKLNKGKAAHLKGKRLGDLDNATDKAMWIRAFDETENPARTYLGLTPEGATTDMITTKTGKPATFMWQSKGNLAKAIEILEDPSQETISRSLGKGHKIRNFYNNIADPLGDYDLTSDTHAVSAAHLTPFSQKGIPVGHNFGGGAIPGVIRGSAQSGQASGTYGLYADAYRLAARARGILPQAMQSPTWELIRENFPKAGVGKLKLQKEIEPIWKMVAAGRITPAQAREQIIDLATKGQGLRLPEWYYQK